MRKALSSALLGFGSILFMVAWTGFPWWPLGEQNAPWYATGAVVTLLAWSTRSQYEPLVLLGSGLFVGTASIGVAAFHALAVSGGSVDAEGFLPFRNAFGCSALIAVFAGLRMWMASPRPRGQVMACVVLVQGAWWAWVFESWFVLPMSRPHWYLNRGRVHLAFVVAGSTVLTLLFVAWLRRKNRPRLARLAISLSSVAILGILVRGCKGLRTDEEIREWWWNAPLSTSCEIWSPEPDVWTPWIDVTASGKIVIKRDTYTLENLTRWLELCGPRMMSGERLFLQPEATATVASLRPVLHACLAHDSPFTGLYLVVRGQAPERDWREVLADVVRVRGGEGRIPLALCEAAPAGLPELHLDADSEDLDCDAFRSAALRIDPRVTMDRVVACLDHLRAQGCMDIHVIVAPD